ncbi:MAG: 4Fe-4S binding protein [Chloroflexi bacterium]|nr:4Fe-4S binding protein [Chloroflexota bacterium]
MSLIQLALAAEEYFRHQSDIQFTETQCVHSKYVHAACDRCVVHCPTEAITARNSLPVLDGERCIRCGVCLHVCPVGAFEHKDGLYHLLNCAERLPDRETLDIVCGYHPATATADRAVDGVIQTGHCLSELGSSAYVGLKAVGVKRIRVRQDACQTCPLRVLQPEIEQSVRHAQRILAVWGMQDDLVLIQQAAPRWHRRPLYQSKNPPVSRRGFLTLLSAESASPKARVIVAAPEERIAPEKSVPRERERLLAALRLLIPPDSGIAAGCVLESDDFVQFRVQESCTACGLCERVCPTGAMRVNMARNSFTVSFAPDACTHCGLCETYCEPGALQAVGYPTLRDVLDGVTLTLHTGTLRRCQRCQTPFAGPVDEALCEVCRHRQSFRGGHLPDAILAKLPPAVRARLNGSPPPEDMQDPG